MRCKACGSYAINHNAHGRDGTDPELCDVCFWRKRVVESSPVPVQPDMGNHISVQPQAEPVEIPYRAYMNDAPRALNINDRAMWVLGWNHCRDAAMKGTP